jgi:hypothetical protein
MTTSEMLRNRLSVHLLQLRAIRVLHSPLRARDGVEGPVSQSPFERECRWDSAVVIHAARISRHSLMDDNPSSG